MPRGFAVEVETAEAGDRPFEIEYRVAARAPKAAERRPQPARLIVVKGKTAQPEYVAGEGRAPTSAAWPN